MNATIGRGFARYVALPAGSLRDHRWLRARDGRSGQRRHLSLARPDPRPGIVATPNTMARPGPPAVVVPGHRWHRYHVLIDMPAGE